MKYLDFEIGGRRLSTIIVLALISSTFLLILGWSWRTFNEFYCIKCFLPTIVLSSSVGLLIASLINEVIKFIK